MTGQTQAGLGDVSGTLRIDGEDFVDNVLRRRRRAVLLYLYAVAVLWGVVRGVTIESAPTESAVRATEGLMLILSLAAQLGFMWFCTVDAKLAGRPLMQLARIGVFLGWPVGVPSYLVWAHGPRGLVTLLLHGVLLLLVMCVSAVAIIYLLL